MDPQPNEIGLSSTASAASSSSMDLTVSTSNNDTMTKPSNDPSLECLKTVEAHFADSLQMLQMFGANMVIGDEKLGTMLQDKSKLRLFLTQIIQGQPASIRSMIDSFLCSGPHRKDIDLLNLSCGRIKNAVLLSCPVPLQGKGDKKTVHSKFRSVSSTG